MKVRLTRVCSDHTRLRTDVVEGEALESPQVGEPFLLFGPPLDKDDLRVIETSPVEEISSKGFKTAYSEYLLEYIDN